MKRVTANACTATVVALFMLLSACSTETPLATAADADQSQTETSEAPPSQDLELDDDSDAEPGPDGEADADAPETEPQPYIPAGQPGSAQDYAAMIERLEAEIPAELRSQVPWPDLRNPNPIVAQVEIFELWIWMAANHTDPRLVEVMAAPSSPSREEVTGVFGRLDSRNVFERRPGRDYEAFDHLVVTFESAGLPLWLARDVPDDAVVVYYSDNSGAVDVIDQDDGSVVEQQPAVPTRAWLSIMVPTDVGWQLWRDQLIEPNDSELETPDVPPPPGAEPQDRTPEV